MNLSAIRLPKTKTGYKSLIKSSKYQDNSLFKKDIVRLLLMKLLLNRCCNGTFYIYFDDKRAVYDYLLSDYSHKIRKTINDATLKS